MKIVMLARRKRYVLATIKVQTLRFVSARSVCHSFVVSNYHDVRGFTLKAKFVKLGEVIGDLSLR